VRANLVINATGSSACGLQFPLRILKTLFTRAAREKRSDLGDRCTNDRAQQPQRSSSGSIYRVGWRFQSFKINDLEMVAQIFTRWNRLTNWLREAERFSAAA
jgi:hypothetical protein